MGETGRWTTSEAVGSRVSFDWFDPPADLGLAACVLPRGLARFARLRFHGAEAITRSLPSMTERAGHLEIGRTVTVIADEARPIHLSVADGWVWTTGAADGHPPIAVSSSLDALVTCLGAYELWHQRLLAVGERDADEYELLRDRAISLFTDLDPAAAAAEHDTWVSNIQALDWLV